MLPGRSPCLRCLHLHRTDRDPAWPQLAAQLVGQNVSARPGAGGGETASAVAAAGVAALQVLGHLDGHHRPASVGRTLDVVLPDGEVERRRWRAHAACGCQRLPGVDLPTGAPERPGRA